MWLISICLTRERLQSSRALGWDTNDYVMDTYRGCGNFSALTFTHTGKRFYSTLRPFGHVTRAAGYTGTQICADPVRGVISILLTNRCYPDDKGLSVIATVRRAFSNAVLAALASDSE